MVSYSTAWSRFRTALLGVKRFVCLASAVFAACAVLALTELQLLWYLRAEYAPRTALQSVGVCDFSVSANGRWAASRMAFRFGTGKTGLEHDVVVHDLRRQVARRLNLHRLKPCIVALAPEADLVAFISLDGSLYVWSGSPEIAVHNEPSSGKVRVLCGPQRGEFQGLAFSPDGRQLATVAGPDICVFGLPDGQLIRRLPHGSHQPRLAFSADAPHLVSVGCQGEVCVWELPSGRQIISTRPTQEKVSVAALSPDGRFAVFALTDGTVRLWSLAAERELWRQSVNGIKKQLRLIRGMVYTACPSHISREGGWVMQEAKTVRQCQCCRCVGIRRASGSGTASSDQFVGISVERTRTPLVCRS